MGDCQRLLGQAAAADGVVLTEQRHLWLNERGHLGLPQQASEVVPLLREIYQRLGGDEAVLATARNTPLPNDYFHAASGTLVEVDEFQHFTTPRLMTLSLYPRDASLGFDLSLYESLCRATAPRADRYRATKDARGFGPGGRQRQRAYYDALRDLAAPAMGHLVVRAPALDQDGKRAWQAVGHRLVPTS